MTLKYKWLLLVAVLAAGTGVVSRKAGSKDKTTAAAVNQQPNIIVILADDLGYGDLQCFNPDSRISTPHLNKLAGEGLLFTDAHSGSAVCTPTRYGLITGRYAFRSPLKKGVLGGYSPSLIEKDRFTIARLLKQAGYSTAVIGKWHLGLNWPVPDSSLLSVPDSPDKWPSGEGLAIREDLTLGPNDLGFDYSYILSSSLDIPPYLYLENGRPLSRTLQEIEGNNNPRGVFWRKGIASADFRIEKTLDHFGTKASAHLATMSKKKTPFFLYLPLTSPHTPWLPAQQFQGKSGAGTYGDFVMHTDHVVGRVMHTLDSLGLKENTLVIFTSDNGADWKPGDRKEFPLHQANGIYRGQKSDVWEGGHRVPFIASWPGMIKHPAVVSQTICLTDLAATFSALTGQVLPANSAQDSYDFSPLLKNPGQKQAVRESVIHHAISGMFAIRKGKWKYIDGQGSGGWSAAPESRLPAQLYNLETDPQETRNLLENHPDIARELKELLDRQKEAGYTRSGAAS